MIHPAFIGRFRYPGNGKSVHMFCDSERGEALFLAREIRELLGYCSNTSLHRTNKMHRDLDTFVLSGENLQSFRETLREIPENTLSISSKTRKILFLRENSIFFILGRTTPKDVLEQCLWLFKEILPLVRPQISSYPSLLLLTFRFEDIQRDVPVLIYHGQITFILHTLPLSNNSWLLEEKGFVEGVHFYNVKMSDIGASNGVIPVHLLPLTGDMDLILEPGLYRLLNMKELERFSVFFLKIERTLLPLIRRMICFWVPRIYSSDTTPRFRSEIIAEGNVPHIVNDRIRDQALLNIRNIKKEIADELRSLSCRLEQVIINEIQNNTSTVSELKKTLESRFEAIEAYVEGREKTEKLRHIRLARSLGLYHSDCNPHIEFVKVLCEYAGGGDDIKRLEIILEGRFHIHRGKNIVHLGDEVYEIWKR